MTGTHSDTVDCPLLLDQDFPVDRSCNVPHLRSAYIDTLQNRCTTRQGKNDLHSNGAGHCETCVFIAIPVCIEGLSVTNVAAAYSRYTLLESTKRGAARSREYTPTQAQELQQTIEVAIQDAVNCFALEGSSAQSKVYSVIDESGRKYIPIISVPQTHMSTA